MKKTSEMKKTSGLMTYCRDCGAAPGQVHMLHCCMERCSVCGGQRLQCESKKACKDHDRAFARWPGMPPEVLYAEALGVSPDQFLDGDYRVFFVKPRIEDAPRPPLRVVQQQGEG
jgi:hypothetical protein